MPRRSPAPSNTRRAVILRPAGEGDLAAMERIREAAFSPQVPILGIRPMPMDEDLAAAVAEGCATVALDDRVVGYATISGEGADIHVETVAVDPAEHSRGIGRALMADVEKKARRGGARTLALYVNSGLPRNVALYERLGFVETGRVPKGPFHRITMEKPLGPLPALKGTVEGLYGRRRTQSFKPAPGYAGLAIDLGAPCGLGAPLRMEVGFGGGEHLIHEAARHLDVTFIGVEPFETGMMKAVRAIEAARLTNAHLFMGDARDVLDWLPEGALERVDILYPDPWPKQRHWKRRFVSMEALDRLARALPAGGTVRFASDIASYVAWTREHAAAHPSFTLADDSAEPWEGWPGTRYEAKALREGRAPRYLTLTRTGRAPSHRRAPAALPNPDAHRLTRVPRAPCLGHSPEEAAMDAVTSPTRPNDLESFWMPYTASRAFKKNPRLCVSAKDMHYTTDDGRQVLDGSAALWCVNAGHCRPPIVEAVQRQVATLDFAPTFQFGHPGAFTLATQLAQMMPEGLDHVFFANSGSEAVDSALKIALAYHRANGEGHRQRFIGRERGYHGSGFGGTAVGGIVKNRMYFGAPAISVDHLRHTHMPENAFSRGCPKHGAELADDLERLVALHDASTIAAVIVEPMAGSTGVLLPPEGYLKRLREICDKHGILLIFDEVITAFGRIGTSSAAEYFGVTPDMMTVAKGLTNATVPMGATIASARIYETILEKAENPIEFFHGYTYSGHPVACAAGLAALETYRDEDLFARSAKLAPAWEERIHELRDCPNVVDIRNLGLVGAIELKPREGAPGARGMEAIWRAFEAGLMVRVTGDIIALSPPLIVSENEIDETFHKLEGVLREIP